MIAFPRIHRFSANNAVMSRMEEGLARGGNTATVPVPLPAPPERGRHYNI
jgi:hypothetical protein